MRLPLRAIALCLLAPGAGACAGRAGTRAGAGVVPIPAPAR